MLTAIVIVNWNTWEDTARCVESCLRLNGFDGAIFVCDNGSTDGSADRLSDWAAGRCSVLPDSDAPELIELTQPGDLGSREFFRGSSTELEARLRHDGGARRRAIYLVESGTNKGFAGGNNVAIRLAMTEPRFELFWLLNADAVADRAALCEMQRHVQGRNVPLVTGSVLLEYWRPDEVQACGGWFDRQRMSAGPMDEGLRRDELLKRPEQMVVGYPVGASLLLNRAYLDSCGLLEESYFLYFEEVDLSLRVPPESVTVCTRSLVYHKGGQSTGAGKGVKERSRFADYCYLRARVLLARKIGSVAVATALVASLYSLVVRLLKGRLDLALHVLPAIYAGLRTSATARCAARNGSAAATSRNR